jgi:hypothetical protein
MNKIETLLGAMTLAEKIGQLTMVAAGYGKRSSQGHSRRQGRKPKLP